MLELEQAAARQTLVNRLETFFADKYNLYFLAIVIFALFVRLYFVFITRTQPLWWDEAEYLNIAKAFAFHFPWDVNVQRPPLFPLLVAGLFYLGAGDLTAKLLFVVLPSIGVVAITYLLAKDLYNRKIALFAAAAMSVFWLLLFNTVRNHTDVLAMFLGALGVYLFWKGYMEKQDWRLLAIAGFIFGLAFMARLLSAINIIILLIFLIFIKQHRFLLDRNLWISAIAGALTIAPYLLWAKLKYGSALAPVFAYSSALTGVYQKFAWYVFSFFNWYGAWVFTILFLAGLLFVFANLFVGSDLLGKKEGREVNADLLMLIWIVVYVIYFVFVARAAEDRWLLPMAIPMFLLAGKALAWVFDFVKKYERRLAFAAVIVILLAGGVFQLARADDLIISKAKTYSQEPYAGIWLKDNTQKTDVIMSANEQAPFAYYTDRQVVGFAGNEQDTIERIKKLKPRYILLTAYYPSERWMFELPNKYQNIRPMQVFFEDATQTQASVIIYEVIDYENFVVKTAEPAGNSTA